MMNTPSRNRTLGTLQRSQEDFDRFIPNRSAMDFDYARYMLTGGKLGKENSGAASTSRDAYQKKLIEVFNMNRGRILKFNSKPPASVDAFEHSSPSSNPTKSRRRIPKSAEKILDAPGLLEDYYTNLLVWGSNNIIAIGIRNSVYLWNASNSAISELVAVDDEDGYVTSLSWASDGRNLAIGLDNSHVQIWDAEAEKKLRTLRGCHRAEVDSLACSDHIITTGGMDAKIVNNDVRMRQHVVGSYRGHKQRICGLRWSGSGRQLASGGADNILHIWDRRSMVSSTSHLSTRQWIYRFEEHTSAVRALAWCPLQSNLLASGGGVMDRSIKLWDTNMGSMLKSVNTGSQVCSLVWSRNEWEILSSHGFEKNELLLWKYPSMKKMAELEGHTSRVLHMAQSPDGCTVATAGDETLRFWNVFGSPREATRAQKANRKLPFSGYHISIR